MARDAPTANGAMIAATLGKALARIRAGCTGRPVFAVANTAGSVRFTWAAAIAAATAPIRLIAGTAVMLITPIEIVSTARPTAMFGSRSLTDRDPRASVIS